MKILKVKYDKKHVSVKYEIARPGKEPDEFDMKCGDLPKSSFCSALDALKDYATDILEAGDWLSGAEVRGVSFSWTNDIMGACITILRPLETANSPLVLSTPHLPEEPYSESGEAFILPEGCGDALRLLLDEAEKYVNGDRAQGTLKEDVGAALKESGVSFSTGGKTVTLTAKHRHQKIPA